MMLLDQLLLNQVELRLILEANLEVYLGIRPNHLISNHQQAEKIFLNKNRIKQCKNFLDLNQFNQMFKVINIIKPACSLDLLFQMEIILSLIFCKMQRTLGYIILLP